MVVCNKEKKAGKACNILKGVIDDSQQQRKKQTDSDAVFCSTTPVKLFFNETKGHVWRTTTKCHTVFLSAVADECVTLNVSPFPRRQPTIVFLPFDRPWDGDSSHGDSSAYVEPVRLSWLPLPSEYNLRVTVPRVGMYAVLRFTISGSAVRFSSLMSTMERAGFTEETSLLSKMWSLKWSKHALRSDFAQLRPFQRINRFPGTWRLGKKDSLHKSLLVAQNRWSETGKKCVNTGDDNCHNEVENFGDFFPNGWVLPDDQKELHVLLTSSKESGNMFIIKPTLEACGRGIYLLKAVEHLDLSSALPNLGLLSQGGTKTARFIVQRYVDDPLLIEGYKFDLRLYVVVTSYAPFRAYLYDEGLVRFATSTYSLSETNLDNGTQPAYNITAHLTNFAINKKSEDFVLPNEAIDHNGEGISASKWTLLTLKEHFHATGLDWDGTMTRIHDLLVKTFLAVEPHVVSEMDEIGGCVKKCCFELYGVDVLLRRPNLPTDSVPTPILMEVNTMPSLSTHYSLLDQCIKGNLIADMLTLVGITAFEGRNKREKMPVPVSQLQSKDQPEFSYEHPFLDALTDVIELEACLIAEEEFLRRTHFQRLCPTSKSYTQYRPLFFHVTDGNDQRRSLNEVLSLWEQAKIDTPPLYYTCSSVTETPEN